MKGPRTSEGIPPARSEGRRLLLKCLAEVKGREVANVCRVSETAVSLWRKGNRGPDRSPAALLERHYGIRVASWDEPRSDENEELACRTSRHVKASRAIVSDVNATKRALLTRIDRASPEALEAALRAIEEHDPEPRRGAA